MTSAHQLGWFAVAGLVGFAVDGGILLLLTQRMDWDPFRARLLSFVAAATVTWLINRTRTFSRPVPRDSLLGEWLSYLGLMVVGGAINIGVYSLVIFTLGQRPWQLMLALVAGVGVGMLVNFTTSRWLLHQEP